MNEKRNHKFWTSANRSRYFLIPHDQELPSGDFGLVSLTGDRLQVDPAAISSFEITAEQAKPYFQAELTRAIQNTKNAFSILADLAAAANNQPSATTQTQKPIPNPIATLLGISVEEQHNNRDAVKAAWDNLRNGIQDLMLGATSDDAAHLEAARDRMRQLRQHLQSQGIDVKESIEDLPNQLREKYAVSESPESRSTLKESVAELQEASKKVDVSFKELIQTLKESAVKIQQAASESQNH